MDNEIVLQNFRITAVDNDVPWAPFPDAVQYTISWGDMGNRQVLTRLELDHGKDDLEAYLLENMFLEMCLKAWRKSKTNIQRDKWSSLNPRRI